MLRWPGWLQGQRLEAQLLPANVRAVVSPHKSRPRSAERLQAACCVAGALQGLSQEAGAQGRQCACAHKVGLGGAHVAVALWDLLKDLHSKAARASSSGEAPAQVVRPHLQRGRSSRNQHGLCSVRHRHTACGCGRLLLL